MDFWKKNELELPLNLTIIVFGITERSMKKQEKQQKKQLYQRFNNPAY